MSDEVNVEFNPSNNLLETSINDFQNDIEFNVDDKTINIEADLSSQDDPSIEGNINIPTFDLESSYNTELELSRNYNESSNKPSINGVTLIGDKSIEDFNIKTSQLKNDGNGKSPFATEDYVQNNSGKINDIKVNGISQEIVNKSVNIKVPIKTSELSNDGDGKSKYATEDYVESNGGKIDSISVNKIKQPIDQNKNVELTLTKNTVGLSNVDNTSDLDKPISNATQKALDNKVNKTIKINGKALTENIDLTYTDVNALSDSTKYGASLSLTIDNSTYIVTAQLKDKDGNNLGQAQIIDLPLESVVVSGSYDNITKEVILTLKDGSNIKFSIVDLIDGLVSKIEFSDLEVRVINIESQIKNKLDKSSVEDSTGDSSTNPISQRAATLAAQAVQTNLNSHILDKDNPHEVTKSQVGLSNVDNTSDLDKPVSNLTKAELEKKANINQIPIVNNSTVTIKQGEETKGSFTLNQSGDATIELDSGGSDSSTKILDAKQSSASSMSAYYKITDTIRVEEGTELVIRFDKNPIYVVPIYLEINDSTYFIYQQSYLQGGEYRSNYTQFSNENWKAGDLIRLQYATQLNSNSNTVQGFVAVENITNSYYYGTSASVITDNSLNEYSDKPVTNKVITTELNKRPTYVETEEVTITVNRLLDLIYPVNSIRLSDNGNEQNFMGGTWIITGQGRTIIGAGVLGDNQYTVGDLIPAGLPNIEGNFTSNYTISGVDNGSGEGAIQSPYNSSAGKYGSTSSSSAWGYGFKFDASKSNPIYGKSNTVHMNSFVTYIYKRIG